MHCKAVAALDLRALDGGWAQGLRFWLGGSSPGTLLGESGDLERFLLLNGLDVA